MAWARVDDGWWAHPKVMGLSMAARGLWISALSWSCHQRKDLVPSAFVAMVGASLDDAAELSDAGLWTPDEGGWRIHGWAEYQELSLSDRRAEIGRKGGQRSGTARRANPRNEANVKQTEFASEANVKQNDFASEANDEAGTHPSPSQPSPSQPIPTHPNGLDSEVISDSQQQQHADGRFAAALDIHIQQAVAEGRTRTPQALRAHIVKTQGNDLADWLMLHPNATADDAAEIVLGTVRPARPLAVVPDPDPEPEDTGPVVSHADHLAALRARAESGDREAIEELAVWDKPAAKALAAAIAAPREAQG